MKICDYLLVYIGGMEMYIIKRNGESVLFNRNKIVDAVNMAIKRTRGESDIQLAESVAERVQNMLLMYDNSKAKKDVTVECIQDLVESSLMTFHAQDVAKSYILYRVMREEKRDKLSELDQKLHDLINLNDEETLLENANKDGKKLSVLKDLSMGIVSKDYTMKYLLPEDIKQSFLDNEIYIHDMDYMYFGSMTNCCLLDIATLLKGGFRCGGTTIREPKSIRSALAAASVALAEGSSLQYGGISANALDTIMAPYIAKSFEKHFKKGVKYLCLDGTPILCDVSMDNVVLKTLYPEAFRYAYEETQEETYQAYEAFETNLNSIINVHGQTAFTSIGFGLNTTSEGRMFIDAALRNRIAGAGYKSETPMFPKIIWQTEKETNLYPGTPNYDLFQLAVECSVVRFYPDYLNQNHPSLQPILDKGKSVTSMGCRSFLTEFYNSKDELIIDGRGNLGVVTINLPRLGLLHGNMLNNDTDETAFYEDLDRVLELAYEAHMIRVNRLFKTKASAAPLFYLEGGFYSEKKLSPDDSIEEVLRAFTISIGYTGLWECVKAMYGKDFYNCDKTWHKAMDIIKYLKAFTTKKKEETGLHFGLYGTPSESLCHKFVTKDREAFGSIKGVTDRKYYTNSFHIHVSEKVDMFTKIAVEAPFTKVSDSGCIMYTEYPNMKHNPDAVQTVITHAMRHESMYYGVNVETDECRICGYNGEIKEDTCPSCGNTDKTKITYVRRVCGYLGRLEQFNEGKRQEVAERVRHDI